MKKLIVLNQKCYLTVDQFKEFLHDFKDSVPTSLEMVLCPNTSFLPYGIGKYDFKLGSQNICPLNITGEVTGLELKSLGVSYVLVGHSERLIYLDESAKYINLKIKEAIDNGITPIICLGETKEEHDRGKTQEVLVKQLKSYLDGVLVDRDLIFAYEPIWSVGTNITPSVNEISEVVDLIKNIIFKKYNKEVRVLYGGSVSLSNIKRFNNIANLDGFLIGRASTACSSLIPILEKIVIDKK